MAGGLLWLPNAASVAAAVALLWLLTRIAQVCWLVSLRPPRTRAWLSARSGWGGCRCRNSLKSLFGVTFMLCGKIRFLNAEVHADTYVFTQVCMCVCLCAWGAWVGLSGNSRASLERVTPTNIKSQGFKDGEERCRVVLQDGLGIKALCLLRTAGL